ncbi:MAG: AmmeMemoRadiSam system protein B [Gammaproteobacteria bacterium]|nr:AmmeMemoRadiSam system protein B [Gammaproteobacteria bacterium]
MTLTPVRPPAVAGSFYPAEPARLRAQVERLLSEARCSADARPRALIVPHAGYIYSGAVAAAAYACLAAWRDSYRRVVLLGPPHRVPVRGLASSDAPAFATPLGAVVVDRATVARFESHACVQPSEAAHAREHALEVQLPFLQATLEDVAIVPLLVGEIAPDALADLLEPWWRDEDSLLLVSTDLSHFLDYAAAVRRDCATDATIRALDASSIGPEQACGCRALNGLLALAARQGAQIERLALCNSGDTAGDRERVVGYASYVLR